MSPAACSRTANREGHRAAMKLQLLTTLLMTATVTFAAADCRVIEHPDSYEVICVGEAASAPRSAPTVEASRHTAHPGQDMADQPTGSGLSDSADRQQQSKSESPVRAGSGRRPQTSSMESARETRMSIIREQVMHENYSRQPVSVQRQKL